MVIIGIDPGVKNTGICIVENDKVIKSLVTEASIEKFVEIFKDLKTVDIVVIERFVQYSNHFVDHEKVNRAIGALEMYFYLKGAKTELVKAVEWQYYLKKKLKIKGDEKSYKKLAKELFGLEFKTEHEADAFFLARYGKLKLNS